LKKILILILKLFYRHIEGANPYHVFATVFFPQKILRINGSVSWPVDPRSRVLHHRNITVGKRSFPGWSHGCYIQGRNGIHIGHNLRMGPHVGLISCNHELDNYDAWSGAKPIQIGDNVWIGMNTVVLPGIHIGNNVVIGAGSIVTTDIPENSIAAGNPCKVIKEKTPYTGLDYSQK